MIVRWVAATIVFLGFVLRARTDLVGFLTRPREFGWDFRVYYHAARALRAGLDPYGPTVLAEISRDPRILGCKYPPLTVAAFAPFTLLGEANATLVYAALKLAALGVFFAILLRRAPRVPEVLVSAGALFGYAMLMDLSAGNVAVFEQLALWTGIALLFQKRWYGFAVFCAVASFAKVTPILYAPVVLLVAPRREALRALALAAGVLLGYVMLNGLVYPDLTDAWFRVAIDTARERAGFHAPTLYRIGLPIGVIAVGAVAIAVSSLLALRRAPDAESRVYFAVVAITLLFPRLKDYNFIVLVAPLGYFLATAWRNGHRWVPLVFVPLAALLTAPPRDPAAVWTDFRPTAFLALLWLTWTIALFARAQRVEPAVPHAA